MSQNNLGKSGYYNNPNWTPGGNGHTGNTGSTTTTGSIGNNASLGKNSGYSGPVPKFVDTSIQLPIRRTDPQYSKLKELIQMHIEYSNLELDYHKLSQGRDHLQAAAYYLRNVID